MEGPVTKRARLERATPPFSDAEFEDADDFYDSPAKPSHSTDSVESRNDSNRPSASALDASAQPSLPGLGLINMTATTFVNSTNTTATSTQAADLTARQAYQATETTGDPRRANDSRPDLDKGNKIVEPGDDDPEFLFSDSESSSSSDSSADSQATNREEYALLDPAEQARILMQEDRGMGEKNGSGIQEHPKTQNEVQDLNFDVPNIVVTPGMEISELGHIYKLVPTEHYILVKGSGSGSKRILESGSLVCRADRTVVGVISEPLGRIEEPFYAIGFKDVNDIALYDLEEGVKIYFVLAHSTFVFTEPLRKQRGNDASNLYDEEVGPDEVYFSDDEVEAAYKRQKKLGKQSRFIEDGNELPRHSFADSRDAQSQPRRQSKTFQDNAALKYDDDDDDGLYTPLTRPTTVSNPRDHVKKPHATGRPDRGCVSRQWTRSRPQPQRRSRKAKTVQGPPASPSESIPGL